MTALLVQDAVDYWNNEKKKKNREKLCLYTGVLFDVWNLWAILVSVAKRLNGGLSFLDC